MAKKEFIDTLSEVILEGLQADGMVKIKGLGTFKKIEVKARKSVNIRTGESIEIPAHSKITFVAESSLADYVNEPLGHLETVMLGTAEEVDAEAEKAVAEEFKAAVETVEQKAEEIEEKVEVAEPEPVAEDAELEPGQKDPISKLAEDAASVKMLLERMNMAPKEEAQPLMETPAPETEEVKEPEHVEEFVEEKVEETVKETVVEEVKPVAAEETKPVVEEPVKPTEEKTAEPEMVKEPETAVVEKKKSYWWIVIVLIIAALLGYGTYYALTHWLGGEKEQEAEIETVEEAEEPEVLEEDTLAAEEPEAEVVMENVNVFEQERVYTEYIDTVTVGQDSRLTMISLRAYGSKNFWVYIYEANRDKISDPGKICAGMKLRIPKVDPRLVDPNSQEALDYAKKLEEKYVK